MEANSTPPQMGHFDGHMAISSNGNGLLEFAGNGWHMGSHFDALADALQVLQR